MALQNQDNQNHAKLSKIKFDVLQLLAIVLVILLSTFLQANMGSSSYASIEEPGLEAPGLRVALALDQPLKVIESYDQWIASFVLSTDNETSITINALTFWPQGNLDRKMLSYHQIYPIRVAIDGEILGEGDGWKKEFIYTENVVSLETPIIVSAEAPVTMNVYVDLPYTYQKRFGVYLSNVETELPTNVNLPVKGFMYGIHNRLGQK